MFPKNLLALAIVVLLTTGCATEPVPTEKARPVPLSRVLERSYLTQADGTGELIIKRDSGFTGSGCSARLYLNGKAMADIETEEKLVLHLPPGDYIVGAKPNGICGGGLTEARATVVKGRQLLFRYGTAGQGVPSIYPTAF